MMTRLKWFLGIVAVAAVGLVAARTAWSAEEGPRPDGPTPPHREQAQPPERPRGDVDRPPVREREGRPAAEGRRPQGPPREREGRPGMEGRRPEGPAGGRDFVPPEGYPFRPPMGPIAPGLADRPPGPDLEAMRQNDPEMFRLVQEDNELDRRTHELGMQCRQAPPEQRERMQRELREVVNKQFEIRQQRRTLELKRIEGELQRLRETIERRAKNREQIIERRVGELTGREDDLGF